VSDARSLAILGGPSTGKTTYLGVLADGLQRKALQHLRLDGLAADSRGFLNLASSLHQGEYPQRTKAVERHELVANLRTEGAILEAARFTLRAGDYDGEEVERVFKDRINGWSEEWQRRASSQGILLLVRGDPAAPAPIQDAAAVDEGAQWRHLRERSGTAAPGTALATSPDLVPSRADLYHGSVSVEEVPPPPRLSPRAPVALPSALELIELLQFIRHIRGLSPGERPTGKERVRIGLLVSAWDAVSESWRKEGPARYFTQRFPLLVDFLWSNFPAEDIFHFGLSATGGDLREKQYSAQYEEEPRGFVEWRDSVQGVRRTEDVGLPLYWVLFGDTAFNAVAP